MPSKSAEYAAKKAIRVAKAAVKQANASNPASTPLKRNIGTSRTRPKIIYEDHQVLVIDKPARVAIQGQFGSPARTRWEDILKGWYIQDCAKSFT